MNRYQKLIKVFENNKNDIEAISMSKYMRDKFNFYGINATKRKEITKEFIKEDKIKKVIDWEFLDLCYSNSHRELQYFVNDYLIAMGKYILYEDLDKIINYINNKQWWDTIDFQDKIIGNMALKYDMNNLMISWSTDTDIWKRRIAIDHQNGRKDKTDKELLEKIIINNLDSKEPFINKAIAWSLRDYSKVNPLWVEEFINKYKTRMTSSTIKDASKYINNISC